MKLYLCTVGAYLILSGGWKLHEVLYSETIRTGEAVAALFFILFGRLTLGGLAFYFAMLS